MHGIWKILVYGPFQHFFVIPPVCVMPKATEMTVFDWYMTGIWHAGVHTPNFLAVMLAPIIQHHIFIIDIDF